MKSNYDFSKGKKNPFAEKLKREGYTIVVRYPPANETESSKRRRIAYRSLHRKSDGSTKSI